jgi:predicted nucleic acid-binding protein
LSTLVLDASVAVKWAMPLCGEPLMDESLRLFKRYTDGEFDFAVPDGFWGARRGRGSLNDAEVTAADSRARDLVTLSSLELLPEALRIAFAYDRSVCDCLYVALAVQSRTELITADERLANALAAHLPVKWLGSF